MQTVDLKKSTAFREYINELLTNVKTVDKTNVLQLGPFVDCPSMVSDSLRVDIIEATQLCCGEYQKEKELIPYEKKGP